MTRRGFLLLSKMRSYWFFGFGYFLSFFIFTLLHCGDVEPLPPGIEGRWERFIPAHPPTRWTIDRGIIAQEITFAGTTVSTVLIPYAERGDTLMLGGDLGSAPRSYLARLIGSEVLECTPLHTGNGPGLGSVLYFERVE